MKCRQDHLLNYSGLYTHPQGMLSAVFPPLNTVIWYVNKIKSSNFTVIFGPAFMWLYSRLETRFLKQPSNELGDHVFHKTKTV